MNELRTELTLEPGPDRKAGQATLHTKNPLIDILVTVVTPSLVLAKLSGTDRLGQQGAFWLALSLPFFYGFWHLAKSRRFNLIAAFGVLSVLLTGGLGFLGVDGIWFAVKEATVPAILGLVIFITLRSQRSIVRTLLYNDKIINVELIETRLKSDENRYQLARLLTQTGYFFVASFFLSSVLHFCLARFILTSPVNTVEFNQELGKLHALAYPAIMLPCATLVGLGLWRMVTGITAITGLPLNEILKEK